jgi:hypothetical protein
MPKRITDRDRAEGPQVKPGQRVCVVGRGTANVVHSHPMVTKVTPTQIVTVKTVKRGGSSWDVERRYWRDSSAREVGGDEWGGTTLHTACQRPKPKG